MVGPEEKFSVSEDEYLFEEWFSTKEDISATDDAEKLVTIAKKNKTHILVLDDYRTFEEEYQTRLLNSDLKWLQFGGELQKKIWGDIIVNSSPKIDSVDYSNYLQSEKTKLLLGPKYAVLRPNFSSVANLKTFSYDTKKVLISFGGGDDRGGIIFALSTLLPETAPSIKFVVISGKYNPRNQEISGWIEKFGQGRVGLYINPRDITSLFIDCDLAILAGGTTTFEAACCGLPMLLLSIAENQISQAKAWQKCGVAYFLGQISSRPHKTLSKYFFKLSQDNTLRSHMASQASRMVDGRGAKRVAKELLKLT